MFNKILIANRGEIACRIIRTAQKLGIQTVAVYSSADENSLHVKKADEAYWIGDAPSAQSYLNQEAILKAALASGSEAIHPGYGFLSENPDFAKQCQDSGIVFIGPSPAAMNAMASKQRAKQLLDNTDVPLTPGYHGDDQNDNHLLAVAEKIGFPVLLKAAAGGGGKGMRAVQNKQEFITALQGARREAKSSFGDETMVIEKLIQNPRHVEVQIMADQHGHVIHLFDRDCSIQRRHQKIIEEAPAPDLPNSLREKMAQAAVTVAQKIKYSGAGTIEFLVENNQAFYFMEMNTRLQVEHPVTELITDLDLVEWQIRIAANEPLPCTQEQVESHGHAIECRLYAEDPHQNFMPSIGEITFLQVPDSKGVRVDSGIEHGSRVTMHYDPMIAKLICWGETRSQAIARVQQALKNFHVGGVKTNIPFLQAIIANPDFKEARLNTSFLGKHDLSLPTFDPDLALKLAACIDYAAARPKIGNDLQTDTFGWQLFQKRQWENQYQLAGDQYRVKLQAVNFNCVDVTINQQTTRYEIEVSQNLLKTNSGKQTQTIWFEDQAGSITLYTESGPVEINRHDWETDSSRRNANPQLTAPMPSTVVSIYKHKGDQVAAGEAIMVLEAMKMEHTISAPQGGVIKDIFYEVGNQVQEGAELVSLEPKEVEMA